MTKFNKIVEVRTVRGIAGTPSHFFFDGIAYGNKTGKGNFDKGILLSGRIQGTVKVVRLNSGRYSLRSIGKTGDGRLLHVNANTLVVVDGVSSTIAEFYSTHA